MQSTVNTRAEAACLRNAAREQTVNLSPELDHGASISLSPDDKFFAVVFARTKEVRTREHVVRLVRLVGTRLMHARCCPCSSGKDIPDKERQRRRACQLSVETHDACERPHLGIQRALPTHICLQG